MSTKRVPIAFPPGDFISEELEARGWKQIDLAEIMGITPYYVNNIVSGRTAISAEIAADLADAFSTSPEFWLNLQTAYNLANMPTSDDESIGRRAEIYSLYPIREMKKRGWISGSQNVDELEAELCEFLGKANLNEECSIKFAARKTNNNQPTSPEQEVWLARAKQLAKEIKINDRYDSNNFDALLAELDSLKTEPDNIKFVPGILSKYGIRILVVEALPRTKIDGACFWLDESSPTIVLSLRYDRIDCFWFSLLHELGHVKNGDRNILDFDLNDSEADMNLLSNKERKADNFASKFLLDQNAFESFMRRNHPGISALKLQAFAINNNVHPGIVVGRYHHCTKQYTHFRKFLSKIRKYIIGEALTDGFGFTISV